MNTFETKVIPARGARGSNQCILRAMKPAQWVVGDDDQPVLEGDSHLCDTRSKSNSFFSSARKMGLKLIRRQEDGGMIRFWVAPPLKK